jgi:hypothetical protein
MAMINPLVALAPLNFLRGFVPLCRQILSLSKGEPKSDRFYFDHFDLRKFFHSASPPHELRPTPSLPEPSNFLRPLRSRDWGTATPPSVLFTLIRLDPDLSRRS